MCGLEFWSAELIVAFGWTLRRRGQFKPPGWTAAAVGSHTLARYIVHHSGSTTGSPSGSPLPIHQRGWLLYWCSIQIYPDGNRGNLSCLMCPIMALETFLHFPFPDQGYHRTRACVGDEDWEEHLPPRVLVALSKDAFWCLWHLHTHQLKPTSQTIV